MAGRCGGLRRGPAKLAAEREAAGAVVRVRGPLRALAPDATKGQGHRTRKQPARAVAGRGLRCRAAAGSGARPAGGRSRRKPRLRNRADVRRFTEQMHGWFSRRSRPIRKRGGSLGRDRSRRIMFELTITAHGHRGVRRRIRTIRPTLRAMSWPTTSAAGCRWNGAGSICSCSDVVAGCVRRRRDQAGACSTGCGCATRAARR